MLETLTAEYILGVPEAECGRIFGPTEAEAQDQYRRLSKRWYPRKMGDDGRVFAHIGILHRVALQKIRAGSWSDPRVAVIKTGVKEFRFTALKRFPFELGETVIGQDEVLFLLDRKYDDLYTHAREALSVLMRWPKDAVRRNVERYLPRFAVYPPSTPAEPRAVTTVRDRRLIRLRDLLARGPLEPKHVAWIMSSLHDLLCYLQVKGITHNAISADHYWIEPEDHYGALLGGWWYATPVGRSLTALPAWALAETPAIGKPKAESRRDLTQLRALARELLGDRPGGRLLHDKAIPRALAAWSMLPSSGDAIKDYMGWQTVLKDAFGKRRYAKLDVRATDIYGKE